MAANQRRLIKEPIVVIVAVVPASVLVAAARFDLF